MWQHPPVQLFPGLKPIGGLAKVVCSKLSTVELQLSYSLNLGWAVLVDLLILVSVRFAVYTASATVLSIE